MTNIPSLIFPDAPAMPAETLPPQGSEAEGEPFGALLASLTAEMLIVTPPALETGAAEASVHPPADEIGEEDATDTGTPDPEPEADVMVLSSCLAMWQILPPTPSVPSPVGELGVSPTTISMTNGEADPAATGNPVPMANPVPTIPDAQPAPGGPATNVQVGAPQPAAPATPEPPAEPSATVFVEPAVVVTVSTVGASPASAVAVPSEIPPSPAKPSEIRGSRPSPASAAVPRTAPDGIPVAKEQRAMPEPVLHRPAKSAPAAFAASETAPETVRVAGRSESGSAPAAPEQTGHDEAHGGTTDSREQRGAADPTPLFAGTETRHASESPATEAKPIASETAHVIEHIERTIERMRAQGGQQMEMRLPMRDGEEVVVKLRIEHGEVKATFQSASEGLRQALETGWSQISPERAAKAAPAVFESSSMQSGMGGFQQSADQRERRGHGPESEAAFTSTMPHFANPKTAAALRTTTSAAPSASLELYA